MGRVVVTGAHGLIGSELVGDLVNEWDVVGVVRKPVDPQPGVAWVVTDLAGGDFVDHLPATADCVIHLAQSRDFREFPQKATSVADVNIRSTAYLADWALRAGASTFVLASSGGVYGGGQHPFREQDRIPSPGPLDYYLGSKLSSELILSPYSGHMTVVILRYFFAYGRAQDQSMLIPRLIRSVREGRPVYLQGNEGLRLNPVHVSDAAAATAAAASLPDSQTINIAGPEVTTLRGLTDRIGAQLGVAPRYEITEGAPRDTVGDISKMSSLLSPPTVSLEQGIARMLSVTA